MTEVLTIGHSTRSIEELVSMLQAHNVSTLIDVRSIPRSRYNPQFNTEVMGVSLGEHGLRYMRMPGLGGLRRTKATSPNMGWKNASFRGFADYMQAPEFEQALAELIHLAGCERVAIMCAEAVPWRCHRSLIADALLAHNISSEHIMSTTRRQPHSLTPFAKVCGCQVVYPAKGKEHG